MCTIKFSIELNTFQINTELLVISVKSAQIFKMDDTYVRHQPVYLSFLDDSPMRHPLGKVLKWEIFSCYFTYHFPRCFFFS